MQWQELKKGILGVADHFSDEKDFFDSWTALFESIDACHNEEARYTLVEHNLLSKLIHLHGLQDSHPIVAWNADHRVDPYDSVLPARQQHVDGDDNVVLGGSESHVTIPQPEAHADKSNPLYDLRVGHMCAFIATSPPSGKKPAPRPIWLAECVSVDLQKEQGLFRWWKTKTATADWKTSGWKDDEKYKYGSGQGIGENGKVGEWLPLLSVIYWGFSLCPFPLREPKRFIYPHDVNEIRAELSTRGVHCTSI